VEQFWPRLWPLKGTVHDLKEEIAVSIAAALQAERERTRAEDIETLRKCLYDPSLKFANDALKAGITDWTNMLIRALEVTQLPQGE
jgi:hypothetical protein